MPWKSSALDDSLCSFFSLSPFFFLSSDSRLPNAEPCAQQQQHPPAPPALTHSRFWRDVWAWEALYGFTALAFPLQSRMANCLVSEFETIAVFKSKPILPLLLPARAASARKTSALRGREDKCDLPFSPPFYLPHFGRFISPGPNGTPRSPIFLDRPPRHRPARPRQRLQRRSLPRGGALAPRETRVRARGRRAPRDTRIRAGTIRA